MRILIQQFNWLGTNSWRHRSSNQKLEPEIEVHPQREDKATSTNADPRIITNRSNQNSANYLIDCFLYPHPHEMRWNMNFRINKLYYKIFRGKTKRIEFSNVKSKLYFQFVLHNLLQFSTMVLRRFSRISKFWIGELLIGIKRENVLRNDVERNFKRRVKSNLCISWLCWQRSCQRTCLR